MKEFIDTNHIEHFNEKQRIVLIANDFDASATSACAWLIDNGIDMKLIKLLPTEENGEKEIETSVLLPSQKPEDFYVECTQTEEKEPIISTGRRTHSLPRMPKLLEWKLINVGDVVYLKNHEEEKATVLSSTEVSYQGQTMSFNEWGMKVTGWTTICICNECYIVGDSMSLADKRLQKIREFENK